jgi:hypothetical protein
MTVHSPDVENLERSIVEPAREQLLGARQLEPLDAVAHKPVRLLSIVVVGGRPDRSSRPHSGVVQTHEQLAVAGHRYSGCVR